MPVQRTLFGRPVRLTLPPRRFQLLFGTLVLFFVAFAFVPVPERVEKTVGSVKDQVLESIPESLHHTLTTPAAHKPPVQANSTHGDSSWFTDWKWRNPFSWSITLDENRAVLPPLKERPFVYTYYEPQKGADRATREAEENVLLVWRRAWWAQGFKPIVLGKAEAVNNELYAKFKTIEQDLGNIDADDDGINGLGSGTQYEMMRWLAWGHMGTGVLTNWLALPMSQRDDSLLNFLREGSFLGVVHFSNYGNSLFCGEKTGINDLLSSVLDAPERLSIAGSVIAAAHGDRYNDVNGAGGVALYDLTTLQTSYGPIAELMVTEGQGAIGLTQLAEMMNAHLHTVWQNTFSAGVAVLKPLRHMTTLVAPAMELAQRLQKCSPSPMPFACPPNLECKLCEDNKASVLTLEAYENKTNAFTIGSVPHPYTATTLDNFHKDIDVTFVRRDTKRDIWLGALTRVYLGPDISSSSRVVTFKELVAGDYGAYRGLWLTAEKESHEDLNWFFGFELPVLDKPETTAELEELDTAPLEVPGDSVVGSVGTTRAPTPGEPKGSELASEREMLKWARSTLKKSYLESRKTKKIREAVEAWNLADTEAWRFAKAYSARRKVERLKWEQEEHRFAGSDRATGKWFS